MYSIERSNASELVRDAARYVMTAIVDRGGKSMSEAIEPVALTLTDVRRNLVMIPERKLNPWVSLAEFPWLVCGRNDVAWLGRFLPRAKQFADDGEHWRAGYGPRMSAWGPLGATGSGVDQLHYVVDELSQNRHSRRAVISLWDPQTDTVPGSKDYPCTNWLSFQYRPLTFALDLTVGMRSNDLLWGFSGVNLYNFTTLLQAVASWAGLVPGRYHHVADNLHVYGDYRETGWAIADTTWDASSEPAGDLNDFGHSLDLFRIHARTLMWGIEQGLAWAEPRLVPTDIGYLRDWAYFMALHPIRTDPVAIREMCRKLEGRREVWTSLAIAYADRARRGGS